MKKNKEQQSEPIYFAPSRYYDAQLIARNKVIAKKEQLKKEKAIEFKLKFSVDDVRSLLDVDHMSDDDIYEQLDNMTNNIHDMAVETSFDVINELFNMKENK